MIVECNDVKICIHELCLGATCDVDGRTGKIVHILRRSVQPEWYDANIEHLYDAYEDFTYAAEYECADGDFVYIFIKMN